jgi:hypothetical protein
MPPYRARRRVRQARLVHVWEFPSYPGIPRVGRLPYRLDSGRRRRRMECDTEIKSDCYSLFARTSSIWLTPRAVASS